MSYSLPKYYFQDIHPDVMEEIMHGMQEALPEFYEERGREDGHAEEDWLRAKEEIAMKKFRTASA